MTITTDWTSPATGGVLDLATGGTVIEAVWSALVSDLNYLGGTDGQSGQILSAAALRQGPIVNEFHFPLPVPHDTDVKALGMWCRQVGTPTSIKFKSTGVAYGPAFEVVAAAASDGVQDTLTYTAEPRVQAGNVLSAAFAVYAAVSRTVTITLSDGTTTKAGTATGAAWTIVALENLTLGGSAVTWQATADAACTFLVAPLGALLGVRALSLPPRHLRYVHKPSTAVVNGADPGGADWTDVDLTSVTSPLAVLAQIRGDYLNDNAATKTLYIRPNGSADAANGGAAIVETAGSRYTQGIKIVLLDDGQIFEYKTDGAGGDAEQVTMNVQGYWEWE